MLAESKVLKILRALQMLYYIILIRKWGRLYNSSKK